MLIGLNGQIGSGKDEFANQARVLSKVQLSFAQSLKTSIAALFDVDDRFIEDHKRNSLVYTKMTGPRFAFTNVRGFRWLNHLPGFRRTINTFTIRDLLQRYGTEVGRDLYGGDFWVDQALPLTYSHSSNWVFLTDVRFPNEARRIHDLGGIVVRVNNGDALNPAHASEQILDTDLIDIEVDNSIRDDNYENLHKEITRVLHAALSKAASLGMRPAPAVDYLMLTEDALKAADEAREAEE